MRTPLPRDAAAAGELLASLQAAKQDLELGQAILVDQLQQSKAENAQLLQHVDKLRARITGSTQDACDIVQHLEERLRAADVRSAALQDQLQALQVQLAQAVQERTALKVGAQRHRVARG